MKDHTPIIAMLAALAMMLGALLALAIAVKDADKTILVTLANGAIGGGVIRAYYETNPAPDRKAWGDTVYGSIWGNANFTTGGAYTDPNYVRDENSDNSLGAYKWTGFFFGMGMAHQWPAVRLGGVAALQATTIHIGFQAPATATSTQVLITSPNGAVTTTACASNGCDAVVDVREGSHWFQLQYLFSGKVVAQTEPDLLQQGR